MDALLNDLCFVVNIDDANNNDVKEIFEIADPFSDDDVEDEDNNIDDEMFGKELFSEHHNASSSTIVYAADGGGSARNILESAAISSPWSSLHIDDDDSAYIHYKTLPIDPMSCLFFWVFFSWHFVNFYYPTFPFFTLFYYFGKRTTRRSKYCVYVGIRYKPCFRPYRGEKSQIR